MTTTASPTTGGSSARTAMTVMVVASVVISLCMGLRQSLGLFLRPMSADIGVSAAMFGLAMAVQNLVWGLAQPLVGAAADRFGARPVLVAASATYAAGLLLMALSGSPAIELQIGGGVLIGLGVSGTAFGVLLGAVSRAMPLERRSWAVGVVSAAGSLGTVIIAPLGQELLDRVGWRETLLCYAVLAIGMALVSVGIGRASQPASNTDMEAEQTVAQAVAEALAHPGFLAMSIAFFACGFQLVFIGTHLPRYIALCGMPPAVGAWALALIGLFNAFGSYAAGKLGTTYNKSKLLAGFYGLRTAAIVLYLLLPVSIASTLVFAAAMGTLWLGVAPLVSGLIGGMFGLRHFNTLFGLAFLSHQLGSFAGAFAGGAILDATGSYLPAWLALIGVGTLATILQWPMDHRPVRRLTEA